MNNNEGKTFTTASGISDIEHQNSLTDGPRGPILIQNVILHGKRFTLTGKNPGTTSCMRSQVTLKFEPM